MDRHAIHLSRAGPFIDIAVVAEVILSSVRKSRDRICNGLIWDLVSSAVPALTFLVFGLCYVIRGDSIEGF
ncbi:hypothetical protein B9Y74_14825 [Stenotrophomonas maltophilia]|nr:hypothetical protein [Stenotrophomonas maltophilia]PJL48138.1 hypothetical protein B9Y74_14825 [Stenotrophomonas maltophilia]